MLLVAVCFFLVTFGSQIFGHTHHHHRNNATGNNTILSSKDSSRYLENITDKDWSIPDIKYLHDVEQLIRKQANEIESRGANYSKNYNNTITTTTANITTTTSTPINEDVKKNAEIPFNVQGIINAPIIVVQTSHPRRRHHQHQHFKQPSSTIAPTSNLTEKQRILPAERPPPPRQTNPGVLEWNNDSTLSAKISAPPALSKNTILNRGSKIPDYNDVTSTIVHPESIQLRHQFARERPIINIPHYANIFPPMPTLSPWYDGYGK